MTGSRASIRKRKGLFGYESPGKGFYENMSIMDDAMMMMLGVPRGGMGPSMASMFAEAAKALETEPVTVSDPKSGLSSMKGGCHEGNGRK